MRKFSDLTKEANQDPKRRARIDAHKRAIYESLLLAELRQHRSLTQTEIAKKLKISQVNVSKFEQRSKQQDIYVSTLRRYVESLGGRLEVQAVFDDEVISIAHLADQTNIQTAPHTHHQ